MSDLKLALVSIAGLVIFATAISGAAGAIGVALGTLLAAPFILDDEE